MTRAAWGALAAGALVLAGVLAAVLLMGNGAAPGGGDDAESMAAARERAQLPPCPEAAEPPVRRLAGVRVTCLADGEQVDLGRALSGRTTLVNVWATWCGPCREELPLLAAYAARSDAVDVLTVQVDSDSVDGVQMLADLQVRLPAVHDGEGVGPFRAALRPKSLPASYLVDEGGQVTFIENPRVFSRVEQIRSAVTEYLEAP